MIKEKTMFAGLTKLAKKVGVTPTHVNRVLSGVCAPSDRLKRKMEKQGLEFDSKGFIIPNWPKVGDETTEV